MSTTQRALPENYVYTGGLHLSDVNLSLPKELKMILEGSSRGTIIFSLGTVVDLVGGFPRKIIKAFRDAWALLNTFNVVASIPESVCREVNVTENVHCYKHLPQASVVRES